jgi:eukaryotic-like serine/threonine-protein kinase
MKNSPESMQEWLSEHINIQPYLPSGINLDDLISVGGQGSVFKGLFENKPAAIKVYFPGQLCTRVDREVSALKKLQCESIVKLLWYGNIQIDSYSLPVVVTEYVEGVNLEKKINQEPLNESELGKLAYDVSLAINFMWDYKIVHRDLKPANILCRPTGRYCVIDLGVARHMDMSSITEMGLTWGTYGYLSPEQTRAVRQLTCKSDIFALGIVLLESAIGRHPTQRDQLRLLARGFHERLPEPIHSMKISSILKSLLEPRPTRRPKPSQILEKLANFSPN